MKAWIGKEVEGMFEGTDTLFIGSPKVTIEQIKKILKEHYVEQIYFGAGKCTKINQDVLQQCKRLHNYIITAEINVNELHKYNIKLLKKINVIVTFNNKNITIISKLIYYETQLKFQNLKDGVLFTTRFYNTESVNLKNLNGKTYKGDKVIL